MEEYGSTPSPEADQLSISRCPNEPPLRKPRILVAEDNSTDLYLIREAVKSSQIDVDMEVVRDGEEATEYFERLDENDSLPFPDLVLLDLNYARDTTGGQEGLDLIAQVKKLEGAPPIVVMTAWATVDLAVAAMRAGARDFFQKPWENARVLAIVQTQLDFSAAEQRGQRLESENQVLRGDAGLIPSKQSALATSGLIAHSPK